jgi:hypothetical protein
MTAKRTKETSVKMTMESAKGDDEQTKHTFDKIGEAAERDA